MVTLSAFADEIATDLPDAARATHLRSAGQCGGFTGPDLFPAAVAALRTLLADLSWEETT